jgi:hypothetical protein
VIDAVRAFQLARRLGGYFDSSSSSNIKISHSSSSSCGTIGLAALIPLHIAASLPSSSSSSSSSAIAVMTRHIKRLSINPPPSPHDTQLKDMAFSVLADAFMAGNRGEGAAWALGHMLPSLDRDLRTLNAVVTGTLLALWATAANAAEAGIRRLLPSGASLGLGCSALGNEEGAGMSRLIPPFVSLSVPWSANWISACILQHAHTVPRPQTPRFIP